MEKMTVAQSLRHARHDFLNELQVLKMYLDLGRTEEAQAKIRSYAEASVHQSRLAVLGMPMTEEWLLTVQWRFPEFRFEMEFLADSAAAANDSGFAGFLEQFFQQAKSGLDPFEEYGCFITIGMASEDLVVELRLAGEWTAVEMPVIKGMEATTTCDSHGTKIAVRAQMEG